MESPFPKSGSGARRNCHRRERCRRPMSRSAGRCVPHNKLSAAVLSQANTGGRALSTNAWARSNRVVLAMGVHVDQREIRSLALGFDCHDVLVAFGPGFQFNYVAAII